MRAVLFALLALSSCARREESAEAAALRFELALQQGDGAEAFKLLTSSTQTRLVALSDAASRASGGRLPASAARMIVSGDPGALSGADGRPLPIATRPLLVEAAHAQVEVTVGAARSSLSLSKESGAWRVEPPAQ